MPCVIVRLLVLQWICITCFVTSETADDAKNLIKELFQTAGYSKTVRPRINQSDIVVVDTVMVLNSIIEFNEQEESMKISGYLYLSWWDDFLRWEKEDYGGLDRLLLPQNDVWRPDVAIHNTFRNFTGLGGSNLLLVVHDDGQVQWYPYQILEATCDVDITYFPFDTQECPLKFSAWSYSKDEVLMVVGEDGIYEKEFEENSRWSLVSSTADTFKGMTQVLFLR